MMFCQNLLLTLIVTNLFIGSRAVDPRKCVESNISPKWTKISSGGDCKQAFKAKLEIEKRNEYVIYFEGESPSNNAEILYKFGSCELELKADGNGKFQLTRLGKDDKSRPIDNLRFVISIYVPNLDDDKENNVISVDGSNSAAICKFASKGQNKIFMEFEQEVKHGEPNAELVLTEREFGKAKLEKAKSLTTTSISSSTTSTSSSTTSTFSSTTTSAPSSPMTTSAPSSNTSSTGPQTQSGTSPDTPPVTQQPRGSKSQGKKKGRKKPKKNEGDSTLLIICIVAGIIALLFVVCSVAIGIWYKRSKARQKREQEEEVEKRQQDIAAYQERLKKAQLPKLKSGEVAPGIPIVHEADRLKASQFKHMGPLKINTDQQFVINPALEEETASSVKSNQPLVWNDEQNMVFDIGSQVEECWKQDQKVQVLRPIRMPGSKPAPRPNEAQNLRAIRED